MGAVAVERSAAAGRRRRGVRVGRAVVGETVVTVGRTASVRVVARSDASVMMEVLARLVQRETLHPQIELLMTPRAVRRCENQKRQSTLDITPVAHGSERDGWTQSEHNKTHRAAADGSILRAIPFSFL